VIHAPAIDELFVAARGLGTWKQRRGQPTVRVYSRPWRTSRPARIVESRSHPSPELETYLRTLPLARRTRVGSSLRFCRVAEGEADLYPRFGPMMEWDVAAGDCIYRNSTAAAERLSPFHYNNADLRVPGFVLGHDETAVRDRVQT
jgi:3'(2'), 5'-bisphosphate nucleotidase